MTTTARIIEVRHEGGIVYLHGVGMTAAEADSLARLLQAAALEAQAWDAGLRHDHERAAEVARLESSGLTHITIAGIGLWVRGATYYARRDGLPVVVSPGRETPARSVAQVGSGPNLEALPHAGRKWRPVADLWEHRRISAWRVAAP
jgi:hypothetical protein